MMPLSMVPCGGTVKVHSIRAGWGLQRRLADMGLTVGTQITIVNCQRPGPVVLNLRGSRLAVGHGIAHKIMVTEV